jgi:transposase
MDHVAIDLGARKSQICVRSADGEIVEEKRVETWDLKQYLASRPKSRVIVETCAEAFGVAEAARELGHETRIVPATLVRTLGVGARRTKTDQRDARALSEVSCRVDLPSVHIPKAQSRERKTFCGMRDSLVSARTKVINQVESYLGLVPGENSSSDRQQRLSITKAGPSALRWVLVQAAWALKRTRRQPAAIPLQLWAHQVELRRGKRIATVALARKLAGILYAIWRDGTEYDGSRGAKMI